MMCTSLCLRVIFRKQRDEFRKNVCIKWEYEKDYSWVYCTNGWMWIFPSAYPVEFGNDDPLALCQNMGLLVQHSLCM